MSEDKTVELENIFLTIAERIRSGTLQLNTWERTSCGSIDKITITFMGAKPIVSAPFKITMEPDWLFRCRIIAHRVAHRPFTSEASLKEVEYATGLVLDAIAERDGLCRYLT